jgi:hypothetical protein
VIVLHITRARAVLLLLSWLWSEGAAAAKMVLVWRHVRCGGRSGLAVLRYGVLSGGSRHDAVITCNKEPSDLKKR